MGNASHNSTHVIHLTVALRCLGTAALAAPARTHYRGLGPRRGPCGINHGGADNSSEVGLRQQVKLRLIEILNIHECKHKLVEHIETSLLLLFNAKYHNALKNSVVFAATEMCKCCDFYINVYSF